MTVKLLGLLVLGAGMAVASRAGDLIARTEFVDQNRVEQTARGFWAGTPAAFVPYVQSAPALDGALDDAAWSNAFQTSQLGLLKQPVDLPAAGEQVSFALVHDGKNLYIGCRCRVRDAGQARKSAAVERDAENIWADDALEIFFEPQGSTYRYLNLTLNSLGTQTDYGATAAGEDKFKLDYAWNSAWEARVGPFDGERLQWTAEIRIPLADLGVAGEVREKDYDIRFNIGRNLRGGKRIFSWARDAYHKPGNFGRLTLLADRPEARWIITDAVFDAARSSVSGTVQRFGGGEAVTVVYSQKPPGGPLSQAEQAVGADAPRRSEFSFPVERREKGLYTLSLALRGKGVERNGFAFRQKLAPGAASPVSYFMLHRKTWPADARRLGCTLALDPGLSAADLGQIGVQFTIRDRQMQVVGQAQRRGFEESLARFWLDIGGLNAGAYRLDVEVDREGQRVHAERLEFVKKDPARNQTGSIPIDVHSDPRRGGGVLPVTVSVPFPDGCLRSRDVPGRLRLKDAAGNAVPFQADVLSAWSEDRAFARWVLLDFQLDLPAGKGGKAQVTLEYNTNAPAARAIAHPVKLAETNGQLVVDTGVLKILIDKKRGSLFREISCDSNGNGSYEPGEASLDATGRVSMVFRDERDKEFADYLCSEREVAVERRGPLRSVIRVSGWYAAQDGEKLGRYIVRLYCYAGLPFIRVFHKFIYTGTSHAAVVKNLAVSLPAKADCRNLTFGMDGMLPDRMEEDKGIESLSLDKGDAYLLQDSLKRCVLNQGNPPGERQVFFTEQGGGWMDASSEQAGVFVAFPKDRFWQEYPKELSAGRDGILTVGLSPLHGGGFIDLRTPVKTIRQAPATGAAKTHEFLIAFHGGGLDRAARNYLLALQDLPFGIVERQWVCESDAGAPIHWPDRARFPDLEKGLETFLTMSVYQHEAHELYGVLDYGDEHNGDGGFTSHSDRYWNNNELGQGPWQYYQWIQYLHSGKRAAFEYASATTRHAMDVDTVHHEPDNPELLGTQNTHELTHWCYRSPHAGIANHTYVDAHQLYYWTQGYEPALDAMLLLKEGIKNAPRIDASDTSGRRCCIPMRYFLALYEMDWDVALLERAREYLDLLLKKQRDDGHFPVGFQDQYWIPFRKYYEITGDERIVQAVRKMGRTEIAGLGDLAIQFAARNMGWHDLLGARYALAQANCTLYADPLYRFNLFNRNSAQIATVWMRNGFGWSDESRLLGIPFLQRAIVAAEASGYKAPGRINSVAWQSSFHDPGRLDIYFVKADAPVNFHFVFNKVQPNYAIQTNAPRHYRLQVLALDGRTLQEKRVPLRPVQLDPEGYHGQSDRGWFEEDLPVPGDLPGGPYCLRIDLPNRYSKVAVQPSDGVPWAYDLAHAQGETPYWGDAFYAFFRVPRETPYFEVRIGYPAQSLPYQNRFILKNPKGEIVCREHLPNYDTIAGKNTTIRLAGSVPFQGEPGVWSVLRLAGRETGVAAEGVPPLFSPHEEAVLSNEMLTRIAASAIIQK